MRVNGPKQGNTIRASDTVAIATLIDTFQHATSVLEDLEKTHREAITQGERSKRIVDNQRSEVESLVVSIDALREIEDRRTKGQEVDAS